MIIAERNESTNRRAADVYFALLACHHWSPRILWEI